MMASCEQTLKFCLMSCALPTSSGRRRWMRTERKQVGELTCFKVYCSLSLVCRFIHLKHTSTTAALRNR
ncbi:hypothetical protein OPV22_027762 [Ensete ventricosum]|uniref:Uncharacterized protein n=1 Tax=Ensete ventricosum TaxID=4639 RepID=A0AAV8PSX0_ENSVE|nr:hypothetical protein OPV22_027762 [Ensete ventricosum]